MSTIHFGSVNTRSVHRQNGVGFEETNKVGTVVSCLTQPASGYFFVAENYPGEPLSYGLHFLARISHQSSVRMTFLPVYGRGEGLSEDLSANRECFVVRRSALRSDFGHGDG